jgi:hypothetical protein
MVLTQEEADQIKEQLSEQLINFPEDKRDAIQDKIFSMSPEELEDFLEQNELSKKCVFCSIVSGNVPSFKIAEDSENIAILELNPVSRGHTLVVPKKHSESLPQSSKEFAEKVALIIKTLNPKDIRLSPTKILGHPIIEVIPIFGGEKDRKKASEKELAEIQQILVQETSKENKKTDENQKKTADTPSEEKREAVVLPKLKPRIP